MFRTYNPTIYTLFVSMLSTLFFCFPSLVRLATDTAWAAATFNLGPHTVTTPHTDLANLLWGWCCIYAFGRYDPKRGGHLILWDLGIAIKFPPGSTIMIPSSFLVHSNVTIRSYETRYSFTQYSAGSLFRWVENGGKTDKAVLAEADAGGCGDTVRAQRAAAARERARHGLESFPRWEGAVRTI